MDRANRLPMVAIGDELGADTTQICSDKADGAAIVAALMGHAADDTAGHHYGNASGKGGRGYPIPKPDPGEVARIRPKLADSRRKKLDMIAHEGPKPR